MFADTERLSEGRMKDMKIDQDPATVLLELLVPRCNLVLPGKFNKLARFVRLNLFVDF